MSALRTGVEKYLKYSRALTTAAETHSIDGNIEQESFGLLKRAAVVRQAEALQAMLKMVDSGHGHFAVTLLRPAYEELIWIEYLNKHVEEAKELVPLLEFYETCESVKAQNDFAGPKGMKVIGFSQQFVKQNEEAHRRTRARIRAVGKKLAWDKRNLLPSMAWLSRKVGRHQDYKFLYLATSRFVHFSVAELFRRIWTSDQRRLTIGSSTFSEFWQDFAMYWGFRLYIDLLIACHDIFSEDTGFDPAMSEEVKGLLKEFEQVPIITIGELEWPPSGHRADNGGPRST
jgi:Family of unknown function (DUF5677)